MRRVHEGGARGRDAPKVAHRHRHDVDASTSPGLRRGLFAVVMVAAVVAVALAAAYWPRGDAPDLYAGGMQFGHVDATVVAVAAGECPSPELNGLPTQCQEVTAELTSGDRAGDEVTFPILDTDFAKPTLSIGDRVVLLDNPAAPEEYRYNYYDQQRDAPLLILAGLFVVCAIVFGRWQGVRALAGVAISFVVLLAFLLPSLLRGNPALPVALAGTILIALVVLYVAHGFTTTTTVALVGTLVSLGVVAVLAQIFVHAADLTGLADESGQVLRVTADAIDLRGLLVAGIIVGALGVLDDVTVTQVAAVAELRRAQPELSRRKLYGAAVRIGREHIASTVNTLVLAYAGASLPLLILFLEGNQPWDRVGASEIVAMEIIRTLVGSIGLVLAVPVTTALAALLLAPPAEAAGALAEPLRDPGGDGDGHRGSGSGSGDDQEGRPDAQFWPEEKPW
jgi:uncharacterized membrane protein